MLIALAAVVTIVVILLFVQYNGLVKLRQMVKGSWSDVDVYLKRRAELIPNLVTSVKAYATHEAQLLEALSEARSRSIALGGQAGARASAEEQVGGNLVRVLALAENYPDLKANDNFLNLQHELSDTEKHIAHARQYYNACVRDFNTKIEAFPSNVVAGMFGFKQAEFFEVTVSSERAAPSAALPD